MDLINCPRCHTPSPGLMDVKVELQNFLLLHQSSDGLFKKVCSTCLQNFEDSIHDLSLIQNRMSAADIVRMQLWNKRLDLIKEALGLMKSEAYSQALPKYEEYLKIIEQVLGVPSASISSQSFAGAGKSEELPVYCLVLWDLIICNDGLNEAAQRAAADKMLELVKVSPLRKTLSDRARQYQKKAKNKKFFKRLQKDFRNDRGCYVATFAYESADHSQVKALRNFRDTVLIQSGFGRTFISAYYLLSPMLVKVLRKIPGARKFSRIFLDWLIALLPN